MDRIYEQLAGADLFISIGTSETSIPLPAAWRWRGKPVELNLEPSDGADLF